MCCAATGGIRDCSFYRSCCMRRLASSGGRGGTLCPSRGIHKCKGIGVVRGGGVHVARFPRGADDVTRLVDSRSPRHWRPALGYMLCGGGGARVPLSLCPAAL